MSYQRYISISKLFRASELQPRKRHYLQRENGSYSSSLENLPFWWFDLYPNSIYIGPKVLI